MRLAVYRGPADQLPDARVQMAVGRAPLQVSAEDPGPGDPSGTRSGNVQRVLGPGEGKVFVH